MKKTIFLVIILILSGLTATWSQTKPFKVKLVNEKGKPHRNTKNFLYPASSCTPYSLDKDGTAILDVLPNDTVFLAFSSYQGIIPVEGLDSVEIVISKNKLIPKADFAKNNDINTGYEVLRKKDVNTPSSSADMSSLGNLNGYKNLAELLTGRFAGVTVNSYTGAVTIRGVNSVNPSSGPLVVVDGHTMTFETANSTVVPRDIKSIDVQRDGALYGSQGMNGVIIISTKRGGE